MIYIGFGGYSTNAVAELGQVEDDLGRFSSVKPAIEQIRVHQACTTSDAAV